MTRFTDGPPISPDDFAASIATFVSVETEKGRRLPGIPTLGGYSFLFGDLHGNPKNFLEESDQTAGRLIELGKTMFDSDPLSTKGDSQIPSAYTYFGQFIDHDLTRLMKFPGDELKVGMLPFDLDNIPRLSNSRSSQLDLDCIYGPPVEYGEPYQIPRDKSGNKFLIEMAITSHDPTYPNKPIRPDTDLPRDPNPQGLHPAYIGDRRNDEHLIISQMHVAFLRAHNALVDNGASFDEARKTLRRLYQYVVVNDYLPRLVEPSIITDLLSDELNVFDRTDEDVSIPLEFSVAAFRTCHSMIRNVYNYNENLERLGLLLIFYPTFLGGYHHVLERWIIDWPRFFDGRNTARVLGPKLGPDLAFLDTHTPFDLATVDLLKGFLVRLPTGEAVAKYLGEMPLRWDQIAEVTSDAQQQALIKGGFINRTPLWFYLLCEAATRKDGRLGTVGGKIVASVIVGLARKSKDSYLRFREWIPKFGKGKGFDLYDLFDLAGVLPNSTN